MQQQLKSRHLQASAAEVNRLAKCRKRQQEAHLTTSAMSSEIHRLLLSALLIITLTLHSGRLSSASQSSTEESSLNPTSESTIEQQPGAPPVVTSTDASTLDEHLPEKTNQIDEHTTTSDPITIVSSTSPFDRLVSGDDNGSPGGGSNSTDFDYILNNLLPTSLPESNAASTAETLGSVVAINGHQLNSGVMNDETASAIPTSTNRPGDDETLSSTQSISLLSDSSASRAKTPLPDRFLASEGASGSTSAESLSAQLIRNRKSSEQQNKQANDTAPPPVKSASPSENSSSTTTKAPATQPGDSLFAPTLSSVDYDDFDLDYQLKMNVSSPGDQTTDSNMNKRDNKVPDWSALIRMPHLFSSNQTTGAPAPAPANFHQTPPILPSLLTIKSTPLTKQELNKVRPHFMFHYQDEGPSNPMDVNQAFINGDLLATASAGGVPLTSMMLVNGTASSSQQAGDNRKSVDTFVSLHNGSPVSLRGGNNFSLVTMNSAASETPTLTTISVDNLAPTELPPAASSTNATGSGNSSVVTSKPASGSSQANQWFNYPHPNMHHNPLLLHHILNKPLVYAQHLGGANQPASPASAGGQSASTTTTTTTTPATTTSTAGPSSSSSSVALNIIEKPTLADEASNQPAPINRTQLQMQLNEMRAIAAASSGLKQQQQQQSQQQQASALQSQQPSAQQAPVPHMSGGSSYARQALDVLNAGAQPLSLGWQHKLASNSPDYLSHLIGAKTHPMPQTGSLYSIPGHSMRPVSFMAPPTRDGPPPQHRLHLPHRPFSPAGRLPSTNMMHHLFGNNLSGALYNNPTLTFTSAPPPPHLPPLRPLGSQFPPHLSSMHLHNRPKQLFPNPQVHLTKHLTRLPDQSAAAFSAGAQHLFGQPHTTGIAGGAKLLAAPSLLQEVYARPNSALIAPGRPTTVTPCPSSAVAAAAQSTSELLKQLNGSHTSSMRAAPAPDLSRSSSNQRLTNMSDEDMSTYVAQLASLNAQVANQSPNWTDSAQSFNTDLPAWLLASQSAANATLPLPPLDASSFRDSQMLSASGGQMSGFSNSSASGGQTGGKNDLELLVEKLLETLAQQSSQSIQSQQQVQMQPSLPPVLPTAQPTASRTMGEFLKNAKLISLPDEVQTQIYQDLSPLLQPVPGASLKQTGPPYSTLMSNQESASNKLPVFRIPESWRKPPAAYSGNTRLPASSETHNYYSIEGHQKQQKKEREQLNQQQQQALQVQQQRQKQVAFIEALRSSVMRMHAPHFNKQTEPESGDINSTNGGDLTTANAEVNSTSLDLNLKGNEDLFDEQSNKPIPDWLERQIIQESLVHESTRVFPFGGSTKSTYIGRGHPPPMMFGGQAAASAAAPGSITVRPAGVTHSHLAQQQVPAKRLYPLHPLHPLHPASRNQFPPPGSMYSPALMHLQRLQIPITTESPLGQSGALMSPAGNMYPMIMNPTKLLADRFPYASAPAYMLKLPTLTGGTITAAGSLSPPSKLLLRQRPNSPMRLLNAAVTMAPPRGIKLVSTMMQSAPSIAHAFHQSPPPAHHYHFRPPPAHFHPLMSAPSAPRFQLSEALRASPLSPAALMPAPPLPHLSHYHPEMHLGPAPAYPPPRPFTMADSHSAAMTSSSPEHLANSQANVASPVNLKPVASTSDAVTTSSSGVSTATGGLQPTQQLLVQPTSYAQQQQQQPQPQQPQQQQTGEILYQTNGVSLPQQSAANALSRLQQATASLVELTSLASLVEEMVGGSEVESSPAAALANAINSISAAQNAALNAQASNGVSSQSSAIGNGNAPSLQQLPGDHPLQQQQQQQVAPFSWKSLLNPILWRDKTLAKATALERLVAAHKAPTSRLKVKYIRVPVAVYESAGGSLAGDGQLTWDPNRQHLVTKTQLAELVGATAGGSSADAANSPAHPVSGASAPLSPPSSATQATSSATTAQTGSSSTGGLSQPQQTQLATSAATSSAASSGDFLFDELTLDSAPKIALAMAQPDLNSEPGARLKYMPVITGAPAPLLKPAHVPVMRKLPVMGDMNPLESALYYSLFEPPPASSETNGLTAAASEAKALKSVASEGKRGRKKKGKKSNSDDDDDDAEEEDDDDVLTSNDLPLIESIISTLIQPPPAGFTSSPLQHSYNADSTLTSPWHRSRHFGSFRPEASSNMETYLHPFSSSASGHHYNHLKPFSSHNKHHHSHRFSLGEVVGALGARKLITSLLNKRKTSRSNSKREAPSQSGHLHQQVQLQLKEKTTTRDKLANGKATGSGKATTHKAMWDNQEQQTASRRSTPDSIFTVDMPSTTPTSTFGFPSFTAYESSAHSHSPKARRATSGNSTSGRPKLIADQTAPVIANRQVPAAAAKFNETSSSSTTTVKPSPSVDTASKRKTSAAPAGADLVQYKFFLKQSSASKPPVPGGSSRRLKENIEESQQSLNEVKRTKGGEHNEKTTTTTRKKDEEKRVSMPLYHVVADHYSKIHSGPNLASKSAVEARKLDASRAAAQHT